MDQKFWDVVEDDREYDIPGDEDAPKRVGDVRSGGNEMDVNARHRLAIARIRMGDIDEGVVGLAFACTHSG